MESDLKKRIEALRMEAEEQTRKGNWTARRRSSLANCPGLRKS